MTIQIPRPRCRVTTPPALTQRSGLERARESRGGPISAPLRESRFHVAHRCFPPLPHLDRRRPGIHGVLHELLHGSGEVEDNRAGADAVHVLPRDGLDFVVRRRHPRPTLFFFQSKSVLFSSLSVDEEEKTLLVAAVTDDDSLDSGVPICPCFLPFLPFICGSRHSGTILLVSQRRVGSFGSSSERFSKRLGRPLNSASSLALTRRPPMRALPSSAGAAQLRASSSPRPALVRQPMTHLEVVAPRR